MMYSQKNIVLVALMQVGVLVLGWLGVGVVQKLAEVRQAELPPLTVQMVWLRWFLFLVPLGWTAIALFVRHFHKYGEEHGEWWLLLGVLILLVLVGVELRACVMPTMDLLRMEIPGNEE